MAAPTLTLYGLKNCDTCRKALSVLGGAGHAVNFVDIRAEADLARLVPLWLTAIGPAALVNKRSTTWRGLSPDEQATALGDGAQAVLIANPTLIKRPVIDTGSKITVGWTAATLENLNTP